MPLFAKSGLGRGRFDKDIWNCMLVSKIYRVSRPFLLSTIALLSTDARAEAPQHAGSALTMEDAVQLAVAQHPSVRGAGQLVRQSGAAVDAAKAGYKPQISGGLDNQINSYRGGSYDSRFTYNATLNASQMLYDFGKVSGNVARARAEAQASEAQMAVAMDDIGRATAEAWLKVYFQQQLLSLSSDHLAAVESITDLVAERERKGASTRSDLEQANSRVNSVRSQNLAIEADAMRARLALMHLTGRTAPVDIIGDIPAILLGNACGLTKGADTPAVRAAEAQRSAAYAQWNVAKAERMPTLSVDGSAGYALTKGSRLYGEYRTTGQVGFNISMPIYQGGSIAAKSQEALYQLRYREDALRQLRLEVAQALADVTATRVGWTARAPVMAARADSLDVTRGLYRQQYFMLGTRTLLELLNSEQEYHAARVDQAQGGHAQRELALACLYYQGQMDDQFGLDEAANAGISDDDATADNAAFIGPKLVGRE